MRERLTSMLVAVSVLAAACGPGEAPTATSAPPRLPATSAPEAAPVAFAYSYEPGDHHDYAFTLDQILDMTIEAEGEEVLLGEEAPQNINVATFVAGTVSYDVAAGPQPGTHQISISGLFDELQIDGVVDGVPLEEGITEEGMVPDLVEVPDITIVIDDQGRLVSVDGEGVPEEFPFLGDPFSRLGDFTSGGLGSHFGPAFPDQPLGMGDTWSSSQAEEIEGFGATMSIDSTYEVVGIEVLDGRQVVVIDFTTETSEVVVDLGEMFRALLAAFDESGAGTADAAAEIPEVTFSITVDPSRATGTVWFNQQAGLVARFTQDTAASISMLMGFSDGNGTARTAVEMDLVMQLAAERLDGSSA